MDQNQIIEIIKSHPELSFEQMRAQAKEAGVNKAQFDQAWRMCKKKQMNLILYLFICFILGAVFYSFSLGQNSEPSILIFSPIYLLGREIFSGYFISVFGSFITGLLFVFLGYNFKRDFFIGFIILLIFIAVDLLAFFLIWSRFEGGS